MDMQRPLAVPAEPWCSCTCMPMASTTHASSDQGFLLAMAQDVLVATEEGVGPSGALLAGAALQLLPHFLATTPSMHLSRRHLHHAAGLFLFGRLASPDDAKPFLVACKGLGQCVSSILHDMASDSKHLLGVDLMQRVMHAITSMCKASEVLAMELFCGGVLGCALRVAQRLVAAQPRGDKKSFAEDMVLKDLRPMARACGEAVPQVAEVRDTMYDGQARAANSARTGDEMVSLVNRMAAAVARAEALPQDALREAHPRERTLEDLRLERPELLVGCRASGCATFNGLNKAELKLHTCSMCRTARYCGPGCQKAAWRAHRGACRRRQAAPG